MGNNKICLNLYVFTENTQSWERNTIASVQVVNSSLFRHSKLSISASCCGTDLTHYNEIIICCFKTFLTVKRCRYIGLDKSWRVTYANWPTVFYKHFSSLGFFPKPNSLYLFKIIFIQFHALHHEALFTVHYQHRYTLICWWCQAYIKHEFIHIQIGTQNEYRYIPLLHSFIFK